MKTINTDSWQLFRIGSVFTVRKGSRLTSANRRPGDIPYIGATIFNNGVTGHIANDEKLHPGNVLTVCYNGPVGTTFYQPEEFWGTDDVAVLYPEFELTKEIGLFLIPIIQEVGRRYAYEDKWKQRDMEQTEIPLPVTQDGTPDWTYMHAEGSRRLTAAEAALDVLENVYEGL